LKQKAAERTLWRTRFGKRIWTCRKTDYVMMIAHTVFLIILWYKAIATLNGVNFLLFIMETEIIRCGAGYPFLFIIKIISSLQTVKPHGLKCN